MPTYDYLCQKCETPFEVRASFDEYSEKQTPKCPQCGSASVIRIFSPGYVWIGRGRRRNQVVGGCWPGAGTGCCG